MKHRELKVGDRVKITGPWGFEYDGGSNRIGDIVTVISVDLGDTEGLPIELDNLYWWRRDNLRALPRKVRNDR